MQQREASKQCDARNNRIDRLTDCADIIMGLLIMGTALLKAQVLHALTLRSLILRLLCVSICVRSV